MFPLFYTLSRLLRSPTRHSLLNPHPITFAFAAACCIIGANMSLSALSTELDTKIVLYLANDTPALSAFSKISKYYRGVAEPYLYKDIVLIDQDDHTIKQLFCTLLARTQLAHQIRSITVQKPKRNIIAKDGERIDADLWKSVGAIQSTMNDIASPIRGYEEGVTRRNAWFSGIFSPESYNIDHILALILCLAPNLDSLNLYQGFRPSAYAPIHSVLRQPWKGEETPFGKFTALKLAGHAMDYRSCPLLPSMISCELRETNIMNLGEIPPLHEPLPMPTQPLLQRIVLIGVQNFSPTLLEKMVNDFSLRNLKELTIEKCGRVMPHSQWDLDGLTRALKDGTPILEHLRWTSQYVDDEVPQQSHPRFRCLKILDKLHTLYVDFDLLVSLHDDDLGTLADPHAVFPPHLENLTLDRCHVRYLNKVIEKLHVHIEAADDQTEEIEMAVTWLASKFPLKRLALIISLERWDYSTRKTLPEELERSDVVFFRYAADVLFKTGLVFEVLRKPYHFDDAPKLLIKHGFTAPLPHSFESLYRKLGYDHERSTDSDYSDESDE